MQKGALDALRLPKVTGAVTAEVGEFCYGEAICLVGLLMF